MVRITKGGKVKIVTSGAYKEMYAPDGWEIASKSRESALVGSLPNEVEEQPEKVEKQPEKEEAEMIEMAEEDEEVEMPISEMNVKQLKQFAAEHDIDVSVAKNKRELQDIIIAEMEE